METAALIRATGVGLVLQLAMVITGHVVVGLRDPGFAIGGTAFSFVAGLLFARLRHGYWSSAITGGAIAGGLCALIGIFVSVMLGDVPASLLMLGTFGSTIAGAAGGLLGRLLPPARARR